MSNFQPSTAAFAHAMTRRDVLALGAGTALALTGVHAQERPSTYPADYGKLIDASKAEKGGVVCYSNMSAAQWRPLLEEFAKVYPWIGVQTLDINGSEAIERYLAETGTGSRSADLILTVAPASWLDMIQRKQIVDYRSPEAGAYPAWSMPSPGVYTAAVDPLVLLWNKALLPQNLWPTSFADLVEKVKANPNVFRKKLASYGAHLTSYGYDTHYAFAKHHGEKVWDWYKVIGPNTRFERAAGPMVEKVTTGEYLLAYFCGSAAARMAVADKARSQFLAMSYITDGNPMVFRGLAVPKAATNINSAKLLLDFVLSSTGQKALARGSRTPVRPSITAADVNGAETFTSIASSIGQQNVVLVDYDPGLISDHAKFVERWKAANGV